MYDVYGQDLYTRLRQSISNHECCNKFIWSLNDRLQKPGKQKKVNNYFHIFFIYMLEIVAKQSTYFSKIEEKYVYGKHL